MVPIPAKSMSVTIGVFFQLSDTTTVKISNHQFENQFIGCSPITLRKEFAYPPVVANMFVKEKAATTVAIPKGRRNTVENMPLPLNSLLSTKATIKASAN